MISHLFLVCGTAVLTWALRTCRHPLLHRAGTLGVFVTSFLAGWLLGGHIWIGVLFASTWLFLPWVEILTRVRKLRLPERKMVEPSLPPNSHDFPIINQITKEVEELEFEYVEDASWEQEDLRHFFRLFYRADLRLRATIVLIEQRDLSFYFLSISSRAQVTDEEFMIWNYPFSYAMKTPPSWHIQRLIGEVSIAEMVARHHEFITARGLTTENLVDEETGNFLAELSRRAAEQIEFNVQAGVLGRTGDGQVRYTLRGMFYLWGQYLCDLVRLS